MKLSTYNEWKHCTTQLCGIPLTSNYIEKRITELSDPNNHHTKKFVESWGEEHLKRVIGWFEQAKKEYTS